MEFKNPTIGQMFNAANFYYTLSEANKAKKAELMTMHIGDTLKSEISKLDSLASDAKTAMRESVENSRQGMIQRIRKQQETSVEAERESSLDGANISPDFKLLELPVVLKDNELQTLYERNHDNPLFVRALQEYEKRHGLKALDYRDKYQIAISNIHDVHNNFLNFTGDLGHFRVLSDNPRMLQEWDDKLTNTLESLGA